MGFNIVSSSDIQHLYSETDIVSAKIYYKISHYLPKLKVQKKTVEFRSQIPSDIADGINKNDK